MTLASWDWAAVTKPSIDHLVRPIHQRFQDLGRRRIFERHVHAWNQFVYATAGTLVGIVGRDWYVIPPEQALWIPTGIEHATGAIHDAKFRNLYIRDDVAGDLPKAPTVFRITPLLRALIVELAEMHDRQETERYVGCVEALVLEQLARQPVLTFHLPWPHHPVLNRLCQSLFDAPADERDLDAWGRQLGASVRTIHRRFEKEVGIGFREWRNRLRLFKAIELLSGGHTVTDVALELGYSTPSAFTFMFRQRMGCGPAEWQRSIRIGNE